MKWYVNTPVEGEKRTRRKFAWEKVTATDKDGKSVQVWLEFYMVTEEFVEHKEAVIQEWRVLHRKAISK